MPEPTYRELLDQKRLESIRQMLCGQPRSCADFIRSLLSTTSTLTRLAYTIDLGTFFDFALKELTCFDAKTADQVTDAEIARLKPRDIEIYADYLSLYYRQTGEGTDEQRMLKNQTYGVMRKLSSLRSFFNYLFRTQRIPANIATLVPLPKKHEKPILLLEREEMQNLLNAIATGEQLTPQQSAFHRLTQARDFAMVMLFLGTGIRVSECVGINLEDLDFHSNALLVTRKGGNQVILYFPQEVADALQAYLAQRDTVTSMPGHEHALFLSLQKRRMTQRAVEKMVKKYAMLVVPLKKRMSPHKLRSTYATNLYHETGDIYLVAEALGHADVNTTRKHYASMSDVRMRHAAASTHLLREEPDSEPSAETRVSPAAVPDSPMSVPSADSPMPFIPERAAGAQAEEPITSESREQESIHVTDATPASVEPAFTAQAAEPLSPPTEESFAVQETEPHSMPSEKPKVMQAVTSTPAATEKMDDTQTMQASLAPTERSLTAQGAESPIQESDTTPEQQPIRQALPASGELNSENPLSAENLPRRPLTHRAQAAAQRSQR